MRNLPHTAMHYLLVLALIAASQFAHAGLLGDTLSFYRLTTYERDGTIFSAASPDFTFIAGSELLPPDGITAYDNGMDLRPQPYPLADGATLKSDQYIFYNRTEDFLGVQVNTERTTITDWSDKSIYFAGGNVFFVNFFGLPVDGTAILALDIRTVSDAITVPEPHVTSLILIGALCAAVGRGRRRKMLATARFDDTGSRSNSCIG